MKWLQRFLRKPRSSLTAAGTSEQLVSIMSPADIQAAGGIPHVGICGRYQDTDGQRVFRTNPAFVRFMHEKIAEFGLVDPGLQAAADKQGKGYLYIIDLRTPDGPMGRVPTEDIIGAFKVEEGRIVPASYREMATHRLMTANGLVQLPPDMHAFLVSSLKQAASAQRSMSCEAGFVPAE